MRRPWLSVALAVLATVASSGSARPPAALAGPGELLLCLRAAPAARSSARPEQGAAGRLDPALVDRVAALAWRLPAAMTVPLAAADLSPLLPVVPRGRVSASDPGSRSPARTTSPDITTAGERLARTLLIRLPLDAGDPAALRDLAASAAAIARALSALPEVEYCVPNRTIRLFGSPPSASPPSAPRSSSSLTTDDPLRHAQWSLDQIDLAAAWEVTRGEPTVLIAVIDTGVSQHVDLQGAIWQNDDPPGNGTTADDAYDQDGDGVVEDWERDDDDDNGYVDDTYGYDFVDAPRIGGPDDPVERDNDPTDGSGHGTMIAGLIAATAENGIGITGVAPGCRVMVVRAGFNAGGCTLCGVLEEDDAAAAVVYAADNGAAVISMSWGDTLYSPVIADAILYAREQGVILVASAGNAHTDGVHYPSGLDGVISVGASDELDSPTSFTNYGPTLDLLAPGVELLSTFEFDDYLSRSGTSFAAPLVAATAGLIRSRDATLTAAEVAAILTGGARDLFPPGADLRTGAGRLDAGRSLAIDRRASARIVAPRTGDGVDQQCTVRVTAEGLQVQSFTVDWGAGRQPAVFTRLTEVRGRQAVEDSVVVWQTAALDPGEYTLRLRVVDGIEGSIEERVLVVVDHTAPTVAGEHAELLWVGTRAQTFIFYDTDDEARGRLLVRQAPGGALLSRIDETYLTRQHTLRLPLDLAAGPVSVELAARNAAGLTGPTSPVILDLVVEDRRARDYALAPTGVAFPDGEIGPDPLDLNGNGRVDFACMEEQPGVIYGPARIYESTGDDAFALQATLPIGLLPRGMGDSDGDGLAEIVGIGAPARGGVGTYLFESPVPGAYPTELVWADTLLAGFAMGFADLDGETAILAIRGDSLAVYRSTGDATAWTRTVVPNAAGSRASLGPTFYAADLDGDGQTEVAVGDTDGNLLIYRNRGGVLEAAGALPLPVAATPRVAGGQLAAGERPRLVTSQEFGLTLQSEALYDRRRHVISVLELTPAGLQFDAARALDVAGVEQGFSALRLANIDGDPEDEILLAAAPDLYVFELGVDEPPAVWTPTFHGEGVRTRALALGDSDGDGRTELFVRLGGTEGAEDRLVTFEARDVTLPGPTPPDGMRLRLPAADRAELTWNDAAPLYRVYRALAPTLDCGATAPVAELTVPVYVDSELAQVDVVTYRVRAVDQVGRESDCSRSLTLRPGAVPRVTRVTPLHARAVQVEFSEPMDASADRLESYALFDPAGDRLELTTALPIAGAQGRLLTLDAPVVVAGVYTLSVGEMRSAAGVPLVAGTRVDFVVGTELPAAPRLYIRQATASGAVIVAELSAPPAPPAGLDPASYALSGGRLVAAVRVVDARVSLELDGGRPLVSGSYQLRLAPGLVGTNGEAIVPGAGDMVELRVVGVVAYPNPYDARTAISPAVTFAGVDPGAEVMLLDAAGRQVERLIAGADGRATFMVRGNPALSSGVYLYRTEVAGEVRLGKLAIMK